jgi:peptidoglycan/LPS O-acetylase OafA/YrhL
LKWAEADTEASCLRLEDSKEGESIRPIGLPVVDYLERRRILVAADPVRNAELWTAAIVSGAVVLAWATWRFVERPAHKWTKNWLSALTKKLGWTSFVALRR